MEFLRSTKRNLPKAGFAALLVLAACSANQSDVDEAQAAYEHDYDDWRLEDKYERQFTRGYVKTEAGVEISVGDICLRATPYRTADYGTFDEYVPSALTIDVKATEEAEATVIRVDAPEGLDDLHFVVGEKMLEPYDEQTALTLVANSCQFGARSGDFRAEEYTDYTDYTGL